MVTLRRKLSCAAILACVFWWSVFQPCFALGPAEGQMHEDFIHRHDHNHGGHTAVIGAGDIDHEVHKLRKPTKAMLNNQTKMRNNLENANLPGMKVIQGFCMDGIHCWPLQVFSITMMAVHILCCFAAFYVSANLYSSGMYSATFYQNGGAVIIIMALLGAAVGAVTSRLFDFCLMKSAAFTGPMMSVFVSFVLIGKRGMSLGAFGGLCAGIPIGSMAESHEVGISLGAVIGLLVGGILGICPFFHWLEMNQRYMNKQHEFGSFAEPGSFSTDSYLGYHKVVHMNTMDFR